MKTNRLAFASLVLSAIALGLSALALNRVVVAGKEETRFTVDVPGVSDRNTVDLGDASSIQPDLAFTGRAVRPAGATDGATPDASAGLRVGEEPRRVVNLGENLDPEAIAERYRVSNEIQHIGPTLDPDTP
jgi:hypothetical protein